MKEKFLIGMMVVVLILIGGCFGTGNENKVKEQPEHQLKEVQQENAEQEKEQPNQEVQSFITDSRATAVKTVKVNDLTSTNRVYGYTKYSENKWTNYLEVYYTGKGSRNISVTGSNLNTVTSVESSSNKYSVRIVSKATASMKLEIIATDMTEFGSVPEMVTLSFRVGTTVGATTTIGLLPTFCVGGQTYGQCTWFASLMKAKKVSFSDGKTLNADPTNANFPRSGGVFIDGTVLDGHMSVSSSVNLSKTDTYNKGKSSEYYIDTYRIEITEYNAVRPYETKSTYSTSYLIKRTKKSGGGFIYSIYQSPKHCNGGRTVTKVMN